MFSLLSNNKKNYTTIKHDFLPLNSIKNIFILFNADDFKQIDLIREDLIQNDKHIVLCSIENKSNSIYQTNNINNFISISKKEISFYGKVKKDIIKRISKNNYDLLLDLTGNSNTILKSIISNINTKFNVGIRGSEKMLHDFILLSTSKQNISESYVQIKYYLSKMKQS